jgi:hypothetical protein
MDTRKETARRDLTFVPRRALILLGALAATASPFACGTGSPTYAVLDDAYSPPASDGGLGPQNVVYRGWWSVSYFGNPVSAGSESPPNRVVAATDYGYAVLAPDWDPTSGTRPTTLLPMRTKSRLAVARGDTLHVVIGNCAAGQPLTQDEADLITTSIFPDEFSGTTYRAATCTAVPIGDDGIDGGATTDAASGTAPDEDVGPGAADAD